MSAAEPPEPSGPPDAPEGPPDAPEGPPEEPAPPRCWRCSSLVREDARFCPSCGAPLAPEDFLAPVAPPSRGPGLGTALATYFVALGGILGLLIAEVTSVRTTLLFDVGLLLLGVVLLIVHWPTLGPRLALPQPLGLRRWAAVFAILGAVFGLLQLTSLAFPELFSDMLAEYRAEDTGLLFAVLQIGPLTAVSEELLFRGVILQGLRATFPERTSIIVSAAMFATLHLAPLNFVHTMAMGLVHGWLVVRTNSLWPGIALHTLWNTAVVLLHA